MAYFLATRPIMAVASFLLVLVSFRTQPHLNIPTGFDWLCAWAIAVTGCATMVQNDYVDRLHDLKKGKQLASDHGTSFFRYTIGWWVLSLVSDFALLNYSLSAWLLAMAVGLLGITYHWTYRFRGLALGIVALTVALATIFPLTIEGSNPMTSLPLAWVAACLIAGREHAKDGEDAPIDIGYKRTLATSRDAFIRTFFGSWAWWLACWGIWFLFPHTSFTLASMGLIPLGAFRNDWYRYTVDLALALALASALTNFSI